MFHLNKQSQRIEFVVLIIPIILVNIITTANVISRDNYATCRERRKQRIRRWRVSTNSRRSFHITANQSTLTKDANDTRVLREFHASHDRDASDSRDRASTGERKGRPDEDSLNTLRAELILRDLSLTSRGPVRRGGGPQVVLLRAKFYLLNNKSPILIIKLFRDCTSYFQRQNIEQSKCKVQRRSPVAHAAQNLLTLHC